MRTVTHKFARLYLSRKLNDNLEIHESERLIKGHRNCQQHCSTHLTQTTSNCERTGTAQVALKEQTRQHVRRNYMIRNGLNTEAKHELKVNYNKEILPFCSEPKYLGVTLDRSLTHRRDLVSLRITLTSRIALMRRLADSGCVLEQQRCEQPHRPWHIQRRSIACATVWCRSAHTRVIDPAIDDAFRIVTGCLPASYTSDWMPACVLHQRTTFLYAQASNLLSFVAKEQYCLRQSTLCRGACTPAPLNDRLPKCECTAFQIETPICTRRTTTYHFICLQ